MDINQKRIEKILLENITLFEDFLKKENDKYGQEIFDHLKKYEKLNNHHSYLFFYSH